MKYFFRGHRPVVLSVLFGMLFAATVSVYASTTIGTDINTGGNLTVTGLSTLGNLGQIDPLTGFDSQLCSVTPAFAPYGNGCPGSTFFRTGASILESYTDPTPARVGLMAQVYTNLSADSPNQDVGLELGNYLTGSHVPGSIYGVEQFLQYDGSGTISTLYGQALNYEANNGAITTGYGYSIFPYFSGTSASGQFYGFYMAAPSVTDSATVTDAYGTWIGDLTGVATNPYYSWFDSRGVRRVKEDSTFNGVGQAIEALYNPQFTKYTPGATNYERVVLGQWNSNVAEIGTQAGGTGTLRSLRLLGTAINIVPVATASLPTCTEGSIKPVTDSNTNTWGATIAGGGSNHVLAYCDGTNWTVMAK
jgi:hypothetical protein